MFQLHRLLVLLTATSTLLLSVNALAATKKLDTPGTPGSAQSPAGASESPVPAPRHSVVGVAIFPNALPLECVFLAFLLFHDYMSSCDGMQADI